MDRYIAGVESKFINGQGNFLLDNPHIPSCWKLLKCNKKRCPAYGLEKIRCWQIVGTFCQPPKKHAGIETKWSDCRQCKVFHAATSNGKLRIQEMINNILFSIRRLDPRLESKNLILALKNIEAFGMRHDLTSREKEILSLLIERTSRSEMADICGVSPETIKTHVKKIYRKCCVFSRKHLFHCLINFGANRRKARR